MVFLGMFVVNLLVTWKEGSWEGWGPLMLWFW